jgi:hypothetical protein
LADEAHPAFDPVPVRREFVEMSLATFGTTKAFAIPAIHDEAEPSPAMNATLHGTSPIACGDKSTRRPIETEARFDLPAIALRGYKIQCNGKFPGTIVVSDWWLSVLVRRLPVGGRAQWLKMEPL